MSLFQNWYTGVLFLVVIAMAGIEMVMLVKQLRQLYPVTMAVVYCLLCLYLVIKLIRTMRAAYQITREETI